MSNKPIPYKKVEFIIQDGIMFHDDVLNAFLSEDGGIPRSTMIALAGTSGAGKTTLCKKLQKELDAKYVSVFFSLETSKNSLARQTKRVDTHDNALICDDSDYQTWSEFMNYLYEHKPTMTIIDSLQHAAKLLSKENGKYKYENYATIVEDLYTWKEKCSGIVIMIVQLNGQGKVEGPEATVFDVDIPLKLIADPKNNERHLEASKNRNGGTIGKIFYEFVNDDRIIKFFTEEEWKVIKNQESLCDIIEFDIKKFLVAFKNKDNYKEFKKEFIKEYDEIANSSDNQVEVLSRMLPVINLLVYKYFEIII
jgi:predicted ATP-dependent serine protease